MRRKPGTRQSHGEKVVKDIRLKTCEQYFAEEMIRIVLDDLKDEYGNLSCVCEAAERD